MRGYQLPLSVTRWQHWSQIGHNFYFVKNHKITNNSTNTEARENKHIFGIVQILEKKFDVRLTKFENYQILLNKISHRLLVTTKQLSG